MSWPRKYFPALTGLDHEDVMNGRPMAEADIDSKTGGAVAVVSHVSLDYWKCPNEVVIDYWYMKPDGRHQTQKLIEIELADDSDPAMVKIESISVLGRSVDVTDKAKVNRVLEAAKQINQALLVEKEMPEVAKIFNTCYMEEVVGETLPITGMRKEGGFDFRPLLRQEFAQHTQPGWTLEVPSHEIARALYGFGIDSEKLSRKEKPITATDVQTGVAFSAQIALNDSRESLGIKGFIEPIEEIIPEGREAAKIETLIDSFWRSSGTSTSLKLDTLTVMGESLKEADHLTQMRGIGIINRVMHDVRWYGYPKVMNHLTEFDLLSLASPTSPPSSLKDGGKMRLISVFGNGLDEITEGFGTELGACKVVIHEGMDENGKLDRVSVIHDFGIFLAKEPGEWTAAAPDVVEWLEDADVLMITHKHLDHCHAISAYAAKNFLRDKIVCATPAVIRNIERQLQKDGVKQNLWPTFQPLQGDRMVKQDGLDYLEGEIHVEKGGIKRMTIEYAVDATPHSARTTPFRYIGRYGDAIKGSYLNPGDMRFGRYNTGDWAGPVPDSSFLNKSFFERGLTGLVEREGLDPTLATRRDTLCDYDVTSFLRQGYAPTEPEVEENQAELLGWFRGWAIMEARLSTNDGMYESNLRVATRTGRHITEVGANMEHAATDFNVLGVNPQRVTPQERNNIQHYLDWYAEKILNDQHADLKRQLKNARRRAESTERDREIRRLEKDIRLIEEIQENRPLVLEEPNSLDRYFLQQQIEEKLSSKYKQPVSLGSIRVGRTSKTAHHIISGDPGRVHILVTGSQGTDAEMEATLSKFLEGRSILDADMKYRQTGLALNTEQTVVMISQTAIPGNDARRENLVRGLVERRDVPVINAIHNGFKMHNLPEDLHTRIVRELKTSGKTFDLEQDGTITVTNMPIHAPGHGQREDVKAWLDLIRADVNTPQHTDNIEAIGKFIELAESKSLKTPGRIFEDFEVVDIDMGDNAENSTVEAIGRIPASIILLKLLRKFRRQYGGYMEGNRVVVHSSPQAGERLRPLMAGGEENEIFKGSFGTVDHEASRRKEKSGPQKPAADEVTAPRERRKYRGYQIPEGLAPE